MICVGRDVPDGWVVIGRYPNPACDGEGNNAWIIKRPGRREVVCGDSPVPEGYVKTRPVRSENCPGEHENAWVIERQDR